MNQQYKQRWVNRLRSQTDLPAKGMLNLKGYMDPLGILCEIVMEDHPIEKVLSRDGSCSIYDGEVVYLPKSVIEITGLKRKDPVLSYQDKRYTISTLNDDFDIPYPEIATLIDEQY